MYAARSQESGQGRTAMYSTSAAALRAAAAERAPEGVRQRARLVVDGAREIGEGAGARERADHGQQRRGVQQHHRDGDEQQLLPGEGQAPHRHEQTAPALWAEAHRAPL